MPFFNLWALLLLKQIFLPTTETPWAVEAFIMVAAILEKDKAADHKIFHSLVAVEGSCGLLEKPCEQQRVQSRAETC